MADVNKTVGIQFQITGQGEAVAGVENVAAATKQIGEQAAAAAAAGVSAWESLEAETAKITREYQQLSEVQAANTAFGEEAAAVIAEQTAATQQLTQAEAARTRATLESADAIAAEIAEADRQAAITAEIQVIMQGAIAAHEAAAAAARQEAAATAELQAVLTNIAAAYTPIEASIAAAAAEMDAFAAASGRAGAGLRAGVVGPLAEVSEAEREILTLTSATYSAIDKLGTATGPKALSKALGEANEALAALEAKIAAVQAEGGVISPAAIANLATFKALIADLGTGVAPALNKVKVATDEVAGSATKATKEAASLRGAMGAVANDGTLLGGVLGKVAISGILFEQVLTQATRAGKSLGDGVGFLVGSLGILGASTSEIGEAFNRMAVTGESLSKALDSVINESQDLAVKQQQLVTAQAAVAAGFIKQGQSAGDSRRLLDLHRVSMGLGVATAEQLDTAFGKLAQDGVRDAGELSKATGKMSAVIEGAFKRSKEEGVSFSVGSAAALQKWRDVAVYIFGQEVPASITKGINAYKQFQEATAGPLRQNELAHEKLGLTVNQLAKDITKLGGDYFKTQDYIRQHSQALAGLAAEIVKTGGVTGKLTEEQEKQIAATSKAIEEAAKEGQAIQGQLSVIDRKRAALALELVQNEQQIAVNKKRLESDTDLVNVSSSAIAALKAETANLEHRNEAIKAGLPIADKTAEALKKDLDTRKLSAEEIEKQRESLNKLKIELESGLIPWEKMPATLRKVILEGLGVEAALNKVQSAVTLNKILMEQWGVTTDKLTDQQKGLAAMLLQDVAGLFAAGQAWDQFNEKQKQAFSAAAAFQASTAHQAELFKQFGAAVVPVIGNLKDITTATDEFKRGFGGLNGTLQENDAKLIANAADIKKLAEEARKFGTVADPEVRKWAAALEAAELRAAKLKQTMADDKALNNFVQGIKNGTTSAGQLATAFQNGSQTQQEYANRLERTAQQLDREAADTVNLAEKQRLAAAAAELHKKAEDALKDSLDKAADSTRKMAKALEEETRALNDTAAGYGRIDAALSAAMGKADAILHGAVKTTELWTDAQKDLINQMAILSDSTGYLGVTIGTMLKRLLDGEITTKQFEDGLRQFAATMGLSGTVVQQFINLLSQLQKAGGGTQKALTDIGQAATTAAPPIEKLGAAVATTAGKTVAAAAAAREFITVWGPNGPVQVAMGAVAAKTTEAGAAIAKTVIVYDQAGKAIEVTLHKVRDSANEMVGSVSAGADKSAHAVTTATQTMMSQADSNLKKWKEANGIIITSFGDVGKAAQDMADKTAKALGIVTKDADATSKSIKNLAGATHDLATQTDQAAQNAKGLGDAIGRTGATAQKTLKDIIYFMGTTGLA